MCFSTTSKNEAQVEEAKEANGEQQAASSNNPLVLRRNSLGHWEVPALGRGVQGVS